MTTDNPTTEARPDGAGETTMHTTQEQLDGSNELTRALEIAGLTAYAFIGDERRETDSDRASVYNAAKACPIQTPLHRGIAADARSIALGVVKKAGRAFPAGVRNALVPVVAAIIDEQDDGAARERVVGAVHMHALRAEQMRPIRLRGTPSEWLTMSFATDDETELVVSISGAERSVELLAGSGDDTRSIEFDCSV